MISTSSAEATTSVTIVAAPAVAAASESTSSDIWVALIAAASTVVASAAWPLAIVIIAFLVRKQIAALLSRVTAIKYGDAELSLEGLFKEKLGDEPPPDANPQADPVVEAAIDDLSTRAPIDAIVTSWLGLERAIETLFGRASLPAAQLVTSGRRGYSVPMAVQNLRGHGVIDMSIYRQVRELQQLRNAVVHDPNALLSEDAVRRYVETAAELTRQLNDILPQNANRDPN